MTLPHEPADDLDRLLDEGAGELGSLYRRLPRAEPPKRLDRSVLGEAARAVRGRQPRAHGWIVGFGSAAGVVLAAGIAWQIGRNVAQQSSHDAFHSAPSVVPVEPITDNSSRRREHTSEAQGTLATQAPAAPSPAQEPARQASARKPYPKPAPPPSPKSAAPPAMSAAPPPPAAVPQSPAPFPTDDAEERAERKNAPVVAGAAAAGAGVASRQQQDKATAGDAVDMVKEEQSSLRAAPAPSGSVELRRDMQLSTDDWIAHIRELVRQGRRQQALESLLLLRQMHPDVAIPPKLRALED